MMVLTTHITTEYVDTMKGLKLKCPRTQAKRHKDIQKIIEIVSETI